MRISRSRDARRQNEIHSKKDWKSKYALIVPNIHENEIPKNSLRIELVPPHELPLEKEKFSFQVGRVSALMHDMHGRLLSLIV